MIRKFTIATAIVVFSTADVPAQYYGVPPGGHSTSESFIRTPTPIPDSIQLRGVGDINTYTYPGAQIPVPQRRERSYNYGGYGSSSNNSNYIIWDK